MINFLSKIIEIALILLREFWWVIIPLFLFVYIKKLFKQYQSLVKKTDDDPIVFLEITFSQDSFKQPVTSMKNFFENLKNIKIKDGKTIIFEILCLKNQLRYFCIVPSSLKDLVEVGVYSQYPDIRIAEIADILSTLPPNIPNVSFDIWGEEYGLKKENIYKTTTIEKDIVSDEDSKIIDPISILAEIADRTDYQGVMVIQIVVRSMTDKEKDSYKEEADGIVGKLLGKAPEPKKSMGKYFAEVFLAVIMGMLNVFSISKDKKEDKKDEKKEDKKDEKKEPSAEDKKLAETLKQKDNFGTFACNFRVSYIAPKEGFQKFVPDALLMFVKQFSTISQNSFDAIADKGVELKVKGAILKWLTSFSKIRVEQQMKNDFYQRTISRKNEKKFFVLNSEELAAIYHFPFQKVSVQSVVYIKSKEAAPPPNLPIILE